MSDEHDERLVLIQLILSARAVAWQFYQQDGRPDAGHAEDVYNHLDNALDAAKRIKPR